MSRPPCDFTTAKAALRAELEKEKQDVSPAKDLPVWFDPLDIHLDIDSGPGQNSRVLHVLFPHPFFEVWFRPRGQERLERAAAGLWKNICIQYGNASGHPAAFPADRQTVPPMPAEQASRFTDTLIPSPDEGTSSGEALLRGMGEGERLGRMLDGSGFPDFDTFLPGSKNRFVLSVLQKAGDGSSTAPILLHGPSGTGKTHLLRATAASLLRHSDREHGHGPIHYLSARDFAALFHSARRDQNRAVLRSSSALFLDDIHLLHKDDATQEALIDIFDSLQERKILVACSASLPGDGGATRLADVLSPPLFSRLCAGLVLALFEPDLDVRLRYAQAGLAAMGLRTGRDIPLLLARNYTNLRNLQGIIRKMAAFQAHTGQLPDESDMYTMLSSSGNAQTINPDAVLALVASHCGYTPKDLRGKKRDHKLVQTRQIAMFICRELLGESYPSLGRIFGGKDHSTVIHAVKKIRQIQLENKDMHNLVTELTQKCRTATF